MRATPSAVTVLSCSSIRSASAERAPSSRSAVSPRLRTSRYVGTVLLHRHGRARPGVLDLELAGLELVRRQPARPAWRTRPPVTTASIPGCGRQPPAAATIGSSSRRHSSGSSMPSCFSPLTMKVGVEFDLVLVLAGQPVLQDDLLQRLVGQARIDLVRARARRPAPAASAPLPGPATSPSAAAAHR